MIISLVVAMDRNGLIGRNNQLPWRLPADLRYFKEITMGKSIVMGRITFESIGRPLPGRKNIVLTKNVDYTASGCIITHSIEEALEAAGEGEVMVVGGAILYRQLMAKANRIYLTEIDTTFDGDTYFPNINKANWREVKRRWYEPDSKNPYRYAFVILERIART